MSREELSSSVQSATMGAEQPGSHAAPALLANPEDLKSGLLRRAQRFYERRKRDKALMRIYSRYSSFTMMEPGTYAANLRILSRKKLPPGIVVECGVWRGGMSAGMAQLLGPGREYYLFDSFEGLPDAKPIDGQSAIDWQKDKSGRNYHDNCTAPIDAARNAMQMSGITSFHLVKGWFDSTVKSFVPPQPVAVLRLDGDWYDSTMVCLTSLFPHVISGGVVIIDDYYTWDGCARAVHDYLSKHQLPNRIQSIDGVCFIEAV